MSAKFEKSRCKGLLVNKYVAIVHKFGRSIKAVVASNVQTTSTVIEYPEQLPYCALRCGVLTDHVQLAFGGAINVRWTCLGDNSLLLW